MVIFMLKKIQIASKNIDVIDVDTITSDRNIVCSNCGHSNSINSYNGNKTYFCKKCNCKLG